MERKNRAEYLALRESGKSLQQIADMYGVSKQRVHEVLSEKSRTNKRTELRQSVKELQAKVDSLQKENDYLKGLCIQSYRELHPFTSEELKTKLKAVTVSVLVGN